MKIEKGISLKPEIQNPDQKIRDAAKMYEQYFLNEMVKSMRKTIDHSQLNEPTMAEKIYTEQLDQKYVENWSERGGVGLADIIYNQLQERFFSNTQKAPVPMGPLPIDRGTTIKIEEGKQPGLPILNSKSTLPTNEVSFLYEWDYTHQPHNREVFTPYAGEVAQVFRLNEDRQIIKIKHPDGLQSTLSFVGDSGALRRGDVLEAGLKVGRLAPHALGLTWQVQQAGA